jgi:hypothetical protein
MKTEDAFVLIDHEHEAEDGLLIKFRMSDDVETERMERFLEAIDTLSRHYDQQSHAEKDMVYKIMSFRDTLSASAGHWKVSRPEGLTLQMTTKLLIALSSVFSGRGASLPVSGTLNSTIQQKWRDGYVVGYDCIAYGNGEIVFANAYSVYDPNTHETAIYWSPLCDTTLASLLKYNDDIWTQVDIFRHPFEFEGQKIVFGDGGMGNEGYIASVTPENDLNWSLFFTNSNPIMRAEMQDRTILAYGETGFIARINIDNPADISVTHANFIKDM